MDQLREENEHNKIEGFGFTPIGKVKDKRLKWLVDEVLPAEVLAFISGYAKAGKSTLALHLAICLTTGKSFLGYYRISRARGYRVLLIPLEDNIGETKAKAKFMLNGSRFPRRLLLSKAHAISLPDDFGKIEADIKNSKADVVIIDPLRRSHSAEENSSTENAPILKKFREIIRQCHVTGIFIHHAGREINHLNEPGDWLRGTSDYNASWETLIGVQKHSDRTDLKIFHKYRSGTEASFNLITGDQVDPITGSHPITDLVYFDKDKGAHAEDEAAVLKALEGGHFSANELENNLKPAKVSRSRIDDALERLALQDRVYHEGKGKKSEWRLK